MTPHVAPMSFCLHLRPECSALAAYLAPQEPKLLSHVHGYPVVYVSLKGRALCSECATELVQEGYDPPVQVGTNWENPDLYCDACSASIEAAYGGDVGEGDTDID